MGSPINTSHVFAGGATVKGIPQSQNPGEAVEHDQLIAAQATKQNNLTGGDGIKIENDVVSFEIGSTGTDHSSAIISGIGIGQLDGTYAIAPFKGVITQSGNHFDLTVGGSRNVYYKEVTASTWAVLVALDGGSGNYYWYAAMTTFDPASITQNVAQFLAPLASIDSDLITTASEQDSNGDFSPASSSEHVEYAVGGNPGGLAIQNGKTVVDFAKTIAEAASNKPFVSSVIKQYVDEQDNHFADSSNIIFSNAVAQLAGDPTKVQAAIEALKALADSISTVVSGNQTTAASEYGNIDNLQAALGSATANLATTHATLSDNVTAKALINELAVLIAALRADATTSLGLSTGGFVGDIGSTVSNGSDLIAALTSIVSAVETVQGDLTARIGAVSFFHNGEEFPLTANQIAGTEALDIVKTGAGTGEENDVAAYVAALSTPRDIRILVSYGTTGDADAGIYVRDKDTGYLTRAADFDESSEIEKGDIVQVLLGGSTAFADFAVSNNSLPVVGTDAIKFELYKASGVGDKQVTEAKLDDALKAVVDNKLVPYESAVITVAANNSTSLVHGHKVYSHPLIKDTSGNVQSFEIDISVDGTMVITSEADSAINVTVRFAGLAL